MLETMTFAMIDCPIFFFCSLARSIFCSLAKSLVFDLTALLVAVSFFSQSLLFPLRLIFSTLSTAAAAAAVCEKLSNIFQFHSVTLQVFLFSPAIFVVVATAVNKAAPLSYSE